MRLVYAKIEGDIFGNKGKTRARDSFGYCIRIHVARSRHIIHLELSRGLCTRIWGLRQDASAGNRAYMGQKEASLLQGSGNWQVVNVLTPDRCLG
jgi:hypothetical protein